MACLIVDSNGDFIHLDPAASRADKIRTVYPTLPAKWYRPAGHMFCVTGKCLLAFMFAIAALLINLVPSWEWWELLVFVPVAYNIYDAVKARNEFKRGKDLRSNPQSFTHRTSEAVNALIRQITWLTRDQATARLLLWAHLNSGAEHTHGTLYKYFRDVQGSSNQKAAEEAAKEMRSNFIPWS